MNKTPNDRSDGSFEPQVMREYTLDPNEKYVSKGMMAFDTLLKKTVSSDSHQSKGVPRSKPLPNVEGQLQTGVKEHTSKPMETIDTTDVKIAASEARTDVKFAELRGEMNVGFADLRSDMNVGFADLRSDMKVQLAELRSDMDTKFSVIQGEFAKRPTTATLIAIVASAAATIIGIILAVIAFGGDRFDAGVGMADVRQAQIARDTAQDQSVREINRKLDQLIAKETAQK